MKNVLCAIAGVFIGLFVAFVLVVAVELFGDMVHPLPEGSKATHEEMCRHVEGFPTWVLAVVVPAWALTALVGTFAARFIGNIYSAAVVGLILLAGVLFNLSMLPYPVWFKVANILVIPAAIVAGTRVPMCRKTAGAGE